MTVISSYLTFPGTGWWMQVLPASEVVFDTGEPFQKMSYRNRYRIGGANNSILLTVPIIGGRDQRSPVKDIRIHNGDRWQVQHWRTLVSVYRRSPFFDHYELSLKPLFEKQFTFLLDFNMAALEWVLLQLRLKLPVQEFSGVPVEGAVLDLRREHNAPVTFPEYYQVFQDRIGFQPGMSILDLLFSEGPRSVEILKG